MISNLQMGVRVALVVVAFALLLGVGLLLRPDGPDARSPVSAAPSPLRRPVSPVRDRTARYSICLNGMAVGTLETRLSQVFRDGRRHLAFEYTVTPTAGVRRLWDFQATGRTLMDPDTLRVRSATMTRHSGDDEKTTTVRFDLKAGVAVLEVRKSDKDTVKHKQTPTDTAFDVPAALLLLGMADWPPGPTGLQVLNGDDLYQWQVSYLHEERIAVPAGEFDTDALKVDVRKLDVEPGREPLPEGKAQTVRVWLERKTHEPVRATCELLLGSFQVEMVEHAADPAE